ncbi:MAG: tetratricopeptide repeat protein [Chloroflexi bacterium]|nr:tetratricopeptide repeat protein [Chloroflexota bacterium]
MRFLLVYGLLLGGFLLFVNSQFDRLQLMALDAVGMAPTPTPFASWWANKGYEDFMAGKLDDALIAFEQAVNQQPNNVNYLYEYGRLLIEINQEGYPERAVELGDRAIQAAPNDPRGYALKAKALVWTGESADAVPVGLTGLEVDPNFAPLYAALARAYTDIGRYQQGLANGEKAVQLDSMDIDARRAYAYALIWVGQRDEAITQLEDAVTINPNLTTPYFELAVQYVARDEYELAVATYEKVLSLDPFNTKALLRLCETFSRIREDSQAEGYCEDAVRLDPNYMEAQRQLGVVRYNRRNYEGAVESLNTCLTLGTETRPPDIQCYYINGLAHFYIADCDKAWEYLNEAANRVGDNPQIMSIIQNGFQLITDNCEAYRSQGIPTIVPTTIPPTPIGGIGG